MGDHQQKELTQMIAVAAIQPDPAQPRKDFAQSDLERLAQSVRGRGQLQPILVRPAGEAGKYWIIFGERRWRAAQLARHRDRRG